MNNKHYAYGFVCIGIAILFAFIAPVLLQIGFQKNNTVGLTIGIFGAISGIGAIVVFMLGIRSILKGLDNR